MKKLRPCPFCEGEAYLEHSSGEYGFWVICSRCGASLPPGGIYYDDEKNAGNMTYLWNSRGRTERKRHLDRWLTREKAKVGANETAHNAQLEPRAEAGEARCSESARSDS